MDVKTIEILHLGVHRADYILGYRQAFLASAGADYVVIYETIESEMNRIVIFKEKQQYGIERYACCENFLEQCCLYISAAESCYINIFT